MIEVGADDMKNYLLKVKLCGMKGIDQEIAISFYHKRVGKDFDAEDDRIKAIYGENGSGKTAILTSLQVLKNVVFNHYYLKQDQTQNILHEIINKKTKTFKIEMELWHRKDAKHSNVYRYKLVLSLDPFDHYCIRYESLEVKNGNTPTNQYKRLFEVNDGHINFVRLPSLDAKVLEEKTRNLLSFQSVLSLDQSIQLEEKLSKNAFHDHLSAMRSSLLAIHIALEDNTSSSKYPMIQDQFIVNKEDYQAFQIYVQQLYNFITVFKRDLTNISIENHENKETYHCELFFVYPDYNVGFPYECSAVKRLVKLYSYLIDVDHGDIVLIDDLDLHLNSVYLMMLIDYFICYGQGQLCMTMHNTMPMAVLKRNKRAIDFITSQGMHSWVPHGNANPENCYRMGLIDGLPSHVEAKDFLGMFDANK